MGPNWHLLFSLNIEAVVFPIFFQIKKLAGSVARRCDITRLEDNFKTIVALIVNS